MAGNRLDNGSTVGANYNQCENIRGFPGLARALKAGRQADEISEKEAVDSIKRLESYFSNAKIVRPSERTIGVEVETLFVENEADFPISQETSQKIFLRLVSDFGWKVEQVKADTIVKVSRTYDNRPHERFSKYELFYELGWNNLELISPVWAGIGRISSGPRELITALSEIQKAASIYQASPLQLSYDFDTDDNTLIMPDKRDEVWWNLDGPALVLLGHIASVHLNIDLVSIEEGFEFIRALNRYYAFKDWPQSKVQKIWERYIAESCAGYEAGRYGLPPEDFEKYLKEISNYKVLMNRVGGELERVACPKHYRDMENVDLDLFLRSVWWWSRLRVRNGKLVLEVRAIPRGKDSDIRSNIIQILAELCIL